MKPVNSLDPPKDLLFVYGSLRPDVGSGAALRLLHEAEVIGRGLMAGRLLDVGDYPGAVYEPHAVDRVFGDVLRLYDPERTFAWLDPYEGYDRNDPEHSEFVRRRVEIMSRDGRTYAWVYLYQRGDDRARPIASGCFVHELSRRKLEPSV